jgi:hypothetical protein
LNDTTKQPAPVFSVVWKEMLEAKNRRELVPLECRVSHDTLKRGTTERKL